MAAQKGENAFDTFDESECGTDKQSSKELGNA